MLFTQISGKYMLLKHTGLKHRDLVTLSAALPLNSSLTHLDFSHNRWLCLVLLINTQAEMMQQLYEIM